MTARRVVAALACAMLLGAGAPAPPATPEFSPGFTATAHTGLVSAKKAQVDVWRLHRGHAGGAGFTLVMVSAPRRAARVRFVMVARRGPAKRLYQRVSCPGALAVINGSFFEGSSGAEKVQGLVQLDGRMAQPTSQRTQGGFLTWDGRGLAVILRVDAAKAERALNAIESSPILIENGANGMNRDDGVHADRVAAGVTKRGDVVLIGAFGDKDDAVSLWEFEALAEAAARAERLELKDLIAMDGGPSAHLYLPRAGLFFGRTAPVFLSDAVCLGVE